MLYILSSQGTPRHSTVNLFTDSIGIVAIGRPLNALSFFILFCIGSHTLKEQVRHKKSVRGGALQICLIRVGNVTQ